MEKVMFVSHGDKGGVGKSVISMLVVEMVLRQGTHVSLVEGDSKTPDLAKRYAGAKNVHLGVLSLNRAGDAENALSRFGDYLESNDAGFVVVNLPAGAGDTLDSNGDLLRGLADALEYNLIVTYALEKNSVASDGLVHSLSHGLLSNVDPDKRWVAYPLYKGDVKEFHWHLSGKRHEYVVGGELQIPALKNTQALNRLEATPGIVSDLVKGRPDGWQILDVASVKRFLDAGVQEVSQMFFEEEK